MPETSRYKGESKADFAKRMASFADRINSPQKYGRLAQGGIQEIREGFPNSGGQIADTWRGLRSGLQEVSEGLPNLNISNLPLGESNLLEAMTGGLVGGRPKRKGKKGKRAARDKQINDTRIDQYRP